MDRQPTTRTANARPPSGDEPSNGTRERPVGRFALGDRRETGGTPTESAADRDPSARRTVLTRRSLLGVGAISIHLLAGCSSPIEVPPALTTKRWDLTERTIRGANYVPTRAYNAYQTWRDYSPAEVERDLGYASRLGLNAVRVFLSFEFWRENPAAHRTAFEHLLDTAVARDMRVLPVLFDTIGVAPSETNVVDENPLTASGTFSPPASVVGDERNWHRATAFATWFATRYRNDPRLLAIDAMNEPDVHGRETARTRLARRILETLAEFEGRVALTVGTLDVENIELFSDTADVLQFHWNFPPSVAEMRSRLGRAEEIRRSVGKPLWLSEWQRVRENGDGWRGSGIGPGEWAPDYASLANVVRESEIDGDLFWSLMIQPAYLIVQRQRGTLSGVFHPDGAVWSRSDVRALAGPTHDRGRYAQRSTWPAWAAVVAERADIETDADVASLAGRAEPPGGDNGRSRAPRSR